MSAFAVIYERSNIPVDPGVLERVMERLSHRGPDGHDILLAGHVALGHWHFWTTPEEVGERQPFAIDGLPFKIVMDGRIDNREDLFKKLSISSAEGLTFSDAALILQAYAYWGKNCFEHFVGEFALVIFDEERDDLICARDQLGDHTLFYSFQDTQIVVASEPWAVAGRNNSMPELNESAAAHFFALKATQDGQTLFNNIYELLPAHVMTVTASNMHTWCYWQPDFSIRLRGRSDEEYAEEFRLLLEESVRRRLRSTSPMGVLMSGGLDSGSVACLAARILAPQQLTSISYVFDELTDCDERKYIDAIKEMWGLHSIQIPCDDVWPYKDWLNWPSNPNQPEGNPYRLLKERAYQRTHDEGIRVLLTGGFGDHLYSAGSNWLADLIAEGRLLEAGREIGYHLRYAGLRWTLQAGYLQHVARRLLDAIPGGSCLRRIRTTPDWLTAISAEYLLKDGDNLAPNLERFGTLLGISAANSSSGEIFNASRHSLELRHPYRDRRLVEFVLTLPAYQLYYHGQYKRVLRTAMQGILPEVIRMRLEPTSLAPLFFRGIEREKTILQNCIQDPTASWHTFVNEKWLLEHCDISNTAVVKESKDLISWLCVSYEKWYKAST